MRPLYKALVNTRERRCSEIPRYPQWKFAISNFFFKTCQVLMKKNLSAGQLKKHGPKLWPMGPWTENS